MAAHRHRGLRVGISFLAVIAFTTGCMGVVKNRIPKIPRSERNVPVETAPVIDLAFECETFNPNEAPNDQYSEGICRSQREYFMKVMKEFDFLANAAEGAESYDYRLAVRANWQNMREGKLPEWDEECFYMMMMLIPCKTKEHLETSAELTLPDGTVIGRAESSADRILISHITGIWLFPLGIPNLPVVIRFSTNTYRNLLPQIGTSLVADQTNRDSRSSIPAVRSGD
jgi:hypothetical protein